ncbi:MAG: N-6 DNA methylase [Verrucomicrobia bacterium]|nr:N-6 DNA methylase [Verrucomicrobiota bacterium]
MIGQFFTPEPVAHFMYRLAKARPGQRVMDPCCGDGAFIRAAPAGCELFGCELDERFHAVLKKLLSQHRFIPGDALTELQSFHNTFDLVIGNPPFSAQSHLEHRPEVLRQFDLGAGRRSQCLEVLFLELFWRLAKPGGRIAIILPDGPLANRPFRYVRAWLLQHAHIETIVSLPRGIFPCTTAKTNILIAKKLPSTASPSREPTRFLVCEGKGELNREDAKARSRSFSSRLRVFPVQLRRCGSAILASDADWRPEAFATASLNVSRGDVRLGDLFHFRTGFACYGSQRGLFDSPTHDRILLIRAKNFSPAGGLRLDTNLAFIRKSGPMFREAAVVRPGEILFVRVGVGCYGRAAVVPPGLTAQADDWIHILTPRAGVDAQAVADWLNAAEGRAAVRCLAKGVGTLSFSKASLADLRVPARCSRRKNTSNRWLPCSVGDARRRRMRGETLTISDNYESY